MRNDETAQAEPVAQIDDKMVEAACRAYDKDQPLEASVCDSSRMRAALAAALAERVVTDTMVERADAFEEVAKWHDKNARLCLEASKDDPRLNADDRRRAFEAHKHHAASAAAIRNKISDERRAALAATEGQNG